MMVYLTMLRHLLLLSLLLCLPGQERTLGLLAPSLKESMKAVSLLDRDTQKIHIHALGIKDIRMAFDKVSYSTGTQKQCDVHIATKDINQAPTVIQPIWQDFIVAHEIAHCSFPSVWNQWAIDLIVDAPFMQQFYDLMNESYADAYAIQFVKRHHGEKQEWHAFEVFLQHFRTSEVTSGSHGNAQVLDYILQNPQATLMDTALLSAYNTFIENPSYNRQMRYTTLVQGLALMQLHHKMYGSDYPQNSDINSLKLAYFKLNSEDKFPDDLITKDTELQSWKVNKERLKTWKTHLEKEPWFQTLADQFLHEKEEQWETVSEFVYRMT